MLLIVYGSSVRAFCSHIFFGGCSLWGINVYLSWKVRVYRLSLVFYYGIIAVDIGGVCGSTSSVGLLLTEFNWDQDIDK